ncbi:MAG: hypothetical protein KIT74_07035 [Fimbriimonadales bacterium]|nr:hypothetical protein [Fimbriimonadales bacterium]
MSSIRIAAAIFALVYLFGANLMQQVHYVQGSLDTYDHWMQPLNIVIAWVLLIVAVMLSVKRDTSEESD